VLLTQKKCPGGEVEVPNIKSAIKRVSVTEKKTNANKIVKSAIRTNLKKSRLAVENSEANASEAVKDSIVVLDKAVSKGFMHKNTAARKKSKLAKALNKA